MRLILFLYSASLLLLLLPVIEMKKPGKGRGLKKARQKLSQDRLRARGLRRQSRSGPSRFGTPNCSEQSESGEDFVDCQDRHLTSIPASNTWSREPKFLLLARNQIKVLHDGTFLGYDSLISLDLQQNQISLLEEGAFDGLTQLTTLLLQHNRLTTLSEEALIPMPNLRYLRLHNNPWKCLCVMESLIRTLQVPSNRNLGNHARCAEPTHLKNKKLKNIDPDSLCKDLEPTGDPNNNLTISIEPSPIRSKSDATMLCHTYVFPKRWMDCRNRGLTQVPSGIPEDVVQVDLSHNSISHLKPRDFQGARSLRNLNLSSNNMEHLDTDRGHSAIFVFADLALFMMRTAERVADIKYPSLSGLLRLHELDLSDNKLRSVQYGVLEDLYFLSQLKLGGNPWVCDYNIHYMVYWLRLHPGVKYSGLLCHSPLEYSGESVQEYVHSYNRECPKDRQLSRPNQDQTDPELWETAMELQGEVEEELEPSHLRVPQKYQIIRLS